MDATAPPAGDERAQSETVGYVLVIGFVIVGSLLVAGFGAIAVSDTEEQLTGERAQKALTQFDSKAALVALGQSDSHEASFGQGVTDSSDLSVEGDRGWLRVTITDRTSGTTREVMNITELGAIVYEGDDVQLAYQGGGVWRQDPEGGQMISPPEFHYRGETLTLPAVNVSGDAVLNDEVTIDRIETVPQFPDFSRNFDNPVRNSIVNVTVGSTFYRGWGDYFEERTEGNVRLDDDNETAGLTLASPIGNVTAESVIAGQVSSGDLSFQANPGPGHPCNSDAYTDSYNSSEGSYCDHSASERGSAGDLTFAGNISTESAAGEVFGNLVSGADITLHGNTPIHGDIRYAGECTVSKGPGKSCEDVQSDDSYETEQIDPPTPTPPIDFAIDNVLSDLHNRGTRVDLTDGDVLEAGEYHTDTIDLDGGRVTLDTSNGDITLGVNETIDLTGNANLDVQGDGEVNLWLGGADDPAQCDMRVKSSRVTAPDDDAGLLTVLGTSDFNGQVESGKFTGVVYAPPGEAGTGEMGVYGRVYGALVTGDVQVGATGGAGGTGCEDVGGAGGSLHYDETLEDKQIVPPDQSIIRLTFLHITENRIEVTG
jgi:hypothetical protein